jgi:hypothetical protein
MNLVKDKISILEELWQEDRPMKSGEVAQKLGFHAGATTMHLLGLKNSGHITTLRNGQYSITDSGKEALGLPKIEKVQATKILAQLSVDKSFHFYIGFDQDSGVSANSLADFCDKIQKTSYKSIEFHVPRKDFEYWFQSLGDLELAKRMGIIRNLNLHGEDLRKKTYDTVKNRYQQLTSL